MLYASSMSQKSELGYFETVINFDEKYFRLAEDCIGAEVHFSYNTQHYIICFPTFEFNPKFKEPQPTADGTRIKLNWIKDNNFDDVSYGRAYSHNPTTKTVLIFSCNRFIVRSRGRVTPLQAKKAKKDLLEWKSLFQQWFEICEYTDLEDSGFTVTQAVELQAYFIPIAKPNTNKRIETNKQTIFLTSIKLHSNGFNKATLTKSLKLTGGVTSLPGHYQQLISALRYFNNENYRQCVLDASTAIEMAMTQMLDLKLTSLKPSERKLIQDKYKQIMGLWDCLGQLGVSMPPQNDIQSKIAEPRNQAIHKGTVISKDIAKEALQFVKSFIYSQLPIK